VKTRNAGLSEKVVELLVQLVATRSGLIAGSAKSASKWLVSFLMIN
jgi:hypothetical protein